MNDPLVISFFELEKPKKSVKELVPIQFSSLNSTIRWDIQNYQIWFH